ncbi:MAG: hypothetical protein ACT4N4_18110, partial [Rhodospirillales bacterium]
FGCLNRLKLTKCVKDWVPFKLRHYPVLLPYQSIQWRYNTQKELPVQGFSVLSRRRRYMALPQGVNADAAIC